MPGEQNLLMHYVGRGGDSGLYEEDRGSPESRARVELGIMRVGR